MDSSGSIEISELKTHLEIVFKIMLALVPQLNRGGVDASTLALISAEDQMMTPLTKHLACSDRSRLRATWQDLKLRTKLSKQRLIKTW